LVLFFHCPNTGMLILLDYYDLSRITLSVDIFLSG
jgi:hypothetical protein